MVDVLHVVLVTLGIGAALYLTACFLFWLVFKIDDIRIWKRDTDSAIESLQYRFKELQEKINASASTARGKPKK